MNFLENIQKIKDTLTHANYMVLTNEILELQLSGGTGGEVLISVCSKLIEIKYTNSKAYCLIEIESSELINYAQSLRLYPEWRGLK
jgi:hypothetical protein